jgi:hypothetical protein
MLVNAFFRNHTEDSGRYRLLGTNNLMLHIVQSQLAIDLNCKIEDLNSERYVLIHCILLAPRRANHLLALSYFDNVYAEVQAMVVKTKSASF